MSPLPVGSGGHRSNLVLIGMMAAGKSAVGRLLAQRLSRPFLDTDGLVEARAGRPIPEIFTADGEGAFRRLESEVIAEVATERNQVVATGGGAILADANRAALRASGTVIWLDAPPEELYQRALCEGVHTRPLLAGDDPLGRLRALYAARAPLYEAAAHLRIDTTGKAPATIVNEIVTNLKETC